MSARARSFAVRFYLFVTSVTFLGLAGLVAFEAYVRWSVNQNFSVLDTNALGALALLLAAQMLGLVLLSRSH